MENFLRMESSGKPLENGKLAEIEKRQGKSVRMER
jgi:hypothetical protein